MDNKRSIIHYEYIKEIALAWIEPELYWPKKIVTTKKYNQKELCPK